MKYKVDQYSIFNKGRKYDVLVFPRVENAWAFDDYPEDDQLMIDGDVEFYRLLQFALASIIADPSKIIYFPINHPGDTSYRAHMTYDAVLLRPELQFKRSQWYDIKPKLNHSHWVGKYTIHYDEKKLCDFWDLYCRKHPRQVDRWGRCFNDKFLKNNVEDLLGDTVFLVLPRDVCYMYHYQTVNAMRWIEEDDFSSAYVMIGYIISNASIEG